VLSRAAAQLVQSVQSRMNTRVSLVPSALVHRIINTSVEIILLRARRRCGIVITTPSAAQQATIVFNPQTHPLCAEDPSDMAKAATHPLISDKRLQQLYVTLLQCRALRQRLKSKAPRGRLISSEALVTGTVTHLLPGDLLASAAGEPWAALARGFSVQKALSGAALPGMLPAVTSPSARFSLAAGYALAQKQADAESRQVALVFSAPGVSTLDGLADALSTAAANKLGMVFVIETGAEQDVSGPRHTDKLGLPGIPVDGDDVIALYRVTQEAMTRARRGGGPTLIDCKPWLMGGKPDPVRKLEEALTRRGIGTSALQQKMAERSRRLEK
jgi:hypothetical protein